MQAAVYERYGSPAVVQLKTVDTPTPKDNEVLIKIRATTVTSADCRLRSFNMPRGFGLISRLVFGITKPRQPILGTELAGDIVALGKHVTKFKVGDPVFAITGFSMAAHAEYKCMPETGAIALKPPGLSYEEAAALVFGGTTALDFFSRGKLQRGEKILINGASGSVGTAAVQLARHFGAEVTGVCSTTNRELVRSLGATHVIDYSAEDFTQNGEKYDLIMDTVGNATFSRSKNSLTQNGRLLLVAAELPDMLAAPWVSLTSGWKIIAGPATERVDDLRLLAKLAEAGEFKAVIDRCYPLQDIAAAHRYVDSGRKKGNVVITVQEKTDVPTKK